MSALKVVFSRNVNLPIEIQKLGIRDQLVVLDESKVGRRRLLDIQELASRTPVQFSIFLEHYGDAFRFAVRGAVSISNLPRLAAIDEASEVESALDNEGTAGTVMAGYTGRNQQGGGWSNYIIHNIPGLI